MEFIISILRTLFFAIDKVVYGLIDDVYGLLLQLSRTSIFSQDAIHQFSQRVYALVGIFMLFKVTVSLINYVLNPDDFVDKEKGFGSIIKHIVLALVMVVLVPYIFSEAYDLQTIILEENTIMNLIFGSPSSREDELQGSNSSYVEAAGQKIQFTIMYTFAQPNYDDYFNDPNYDLADCGETYTPDENGNYKFRQLPVFNDNKAEASSKFIYELNEKCWGKYNRTDDVYDDGPLYKAFKEAGLTQAYNNYAQGVAQQSFNMFFRKDVITAQISGDERYLVDYKMGISTAVGVGVLYLFLMFCIDIAIRSVKLGFLQLIAPIPIISYCDPKSGKDGMFKKWSQMCFKTYIDLFIRLFALYFGIYIISLIGKFRDVITDAPVSGWLVSIFMIIGILIFVKKLPEFLKDALGLEGGTFKDFKLNPLRRLENDALGGKIFKKPADALSKLPMAPLNGIGLLGKKTIGGIDAKRNGGKFSTGWSNVHGKLHNNFYKKLDEWAPQSAEARKNRAKGVQNQEQRVLRERIGGPIGAQINDKLDDIARSSKHLADAEQWKRKNYAEYATAKYQTEAKFFKHDEYKKSYSALAEAKIQATTKQQNADDLNQKYQALLNGSNVSVGGITYNHTDQGNIDAFKHMLDGAVASAKSAQGKVDAAKLVHDDVKLKYGDDAEIETAYDEYGKSHEWKAGPRNSSGGSAGPGHWE